MTTAPDALTVPPGRGRVWPLAVLTSRANVRQPMVYGTMAALPLSYFLVLTLLAGSSLGRHAFLGAMVSYAVTGGVVSLPQTVVGYRIRHLHDMIVASPIRPLTYTFALAVSRLLYVAPPLVVVFAVFAVAGGVPVWRCVALLPLVGVAWAVGNALGFAVARRWDNPAYVSAVANMIGYVLVLLPPVYYPLSLLPAAVRPFVLLVPTANAAELMRAVAGLADVRPAAAAAQVALLGATVAACLWFAASDRRWQEP